MRQLFTNFPSRVRIRGKYGGLFALLGFLSYWSFLSFSLNAQVSQYQEKGTLLYVRFSNEQTLTASSAHTNKKRLTYVMKYNLEDNAVALHVATRNPAKVQEIKNYLSGIEGFVSVEEKSLLEMNALTNHQWENVLPDTTFIQEQEKELDTDVHELMHNHGHSFTPADNTNVSPGVQLIEKKNKFVHDLKPAANPFPCCANSQEGNIWYFGNQAGLSFNTNPPTILTNNPMNAQDCSTAYSNPNNGSIMAFTNGQVCYGANLLPMPNGGGLTGHLNCTQGAIIIPRPGTNNTQLYLFTNSCDSPGSPFPAGQVRYSLIDMTLNGGNGDIVAGQKNILLNNNSSERMTGIIHANGCDYWLLVKEQGNNIYRAYLITSAGVNPVPVTSATGTFQNQQTWNEGAMRISPNGQRIALAAFTGSAATGHIQLSDFNDATGVVSNTITLNVSYHAYGVEFSPNSNVLYTNCCAYPMYQFNLQAANIQASQVNLGSCGWHSQLMLAPNCKIYNTDASYGYNCMSVINQPNVLGNGCNYVYPCGQSVAPKTITAGAINVMPHIFRQHVAQITPGPVVNVCGTSQLLTGSPASVQCQTYLYQWKLNGNNIPGATSSAYTATQSGTYSLDVTHPNGCVSTATVTVTITPPPASSLTVNPTNVCTGQNVTLTPGPSQQGWIHSWNCNGCSPAPSGGGSQTVSWSTPGVKTVSYTFTAGVCQPQTFTQVVTVNPYPAGNITATGPVCASNSLTSTASTITFNPTAGTVLAGATYAWNCGGCNGGNPTGTNGPFTSSWLTSGVKTYTLTITNPAPSSCATTFTQTVSVTPLPSSAFTATPNPLCVTASQSQPTSTVLNGPAGGAVYNWNCDGCVTPPATTAQTPTVMWSSPGVKTVTLQITNSAAPGCTSPISTTLVTVNQAPDGVLSLSNNQVCSNNAAAGSLMAVTATFTPTAGTLVSPTYSWNCGGCVGGNPTTAGPHSLSWAPGSGGVKTITLTVTNQAPTNCSKTFTALVTVNEAPSSTFTLSANPLCTNTSTTLASTQLTFTGTNVLPGATYSWNCVGCVTAPGNNSGPHTVSWANTPANHGVKTLSLIVTNPNGCVSPTSSVVVTVNPTPTNVFSIPGPICETLSVTNFSSTLSYNGQFAQGAATYNWGCDGCITPPSNTAGPFNLSWSTPGNKTLSLQVVNPAPTSCAAPTQTVELEVKAAPTSSFSANNACTALSTTNNFSTVQYTGNALAGATYNWTCDGCNGSMNGAGPHNISWTAPGNKTLTLQVQNPAPGNCTSTITSVIVTVSPTPTGNFNITSVACTAPSLTDNTATLTYTGVSLVGASFSWNCDGCNTTMSGTAGPHILSWNTPGVKTLTLIVTNPGLPACTSPAFSATTLIRQTPTSAFTAPSVCVNASRTNKISNITFNGIASPGDNFYWNCDGCVGGNPQGQDPSVSWAQTGVKSVTLQVVSPGQATCTSDITTVLVTVNPAPQDPIVNDMVRCGVGAVTLTALPGANGNTVRWYNSASLPSQLLHSGSPYQLGYLGTTTTFYVATFNDVTGCESPNALPLVMTIAPIPGVPSVAPVARCGSGPVTFSLTNGNPSGDAIHMFASPFSTQPVGNPGIANNPPYYLSDSVSTTTTFYFSSFKTYATFPPITCESQRVAAIATVHPIPAIPISTNEKRCGPGPITFLLDMGHPAGTEAYLYDVPSGGAHLDYTNGNSNPPKYQLTTPLLPAAPPYFPYSYQDTFYIEARNHITGCKSGRGMYIGTVNVTPHPPTIPDLKRCGPGALTFTATMIVPGNAVAGNSIRVYPVETGGMPIATVQSPPYIFQTPTLTSTTTFYFESKIDSTNCPSARIPAVATIFPYLNPPVTSDVQRCGPGVATLTAQTGFATGTHVRLYDLPIGGSVVAMDTIAPFEIQTPSVATTTIFYLESYFPQGPCWSSMRTPVKVIINPAPDTAIVPSVSRCGAGQVELLPKLSSPNGNVMRLYTQPTGGNMIAMDNLQTNPPFKLILDNVTTNSTYYVEVYNSITGCVSPGRREVTVTIHSKPGTPIALDVSRCGAGQVSLPFNFADDIATNIRVYDALSGGNLLQTLTGLPYDFVATLSTTSTFYASAYNPITGCESGRAIARAVIHPITSQPVVSDIARCGGGVVTLSAAMGTVSGTGIEVYDLPIGGTLVAADNTPPYELTLGNITLTTTFYVVAANDLTGCVSPRKPVEAVILPVPSMPDALPVSRCGAGGVTITAAMGANPGDRIRLYEQAVGGNPTAIAIAAPYLLRTPVVNTNTTYYIEAQNSATGCVSERNTVQVSILPLPGVPYAQDLFHCGAGSVIITANMGAPAGDIIQLYSTNAGGAPLATVDVSPYELTTPIVTTTTTFYLEAKNSSTGCLGHRGSVKVTIIERISAPIVFPASRCGSGVVTFSARMGAIAGNAIRYYDQPVGGALLHTAEFAPYAYTTPHLNTNTTFYVEALDLNQNCSSERVPATAIINPLPGIPYATDVTRCGTGAVTFSAVATQPVPTEIRLYKTELGGAMLSVDKNAPFEFTTPYLTQHGNYVFYLEAYNEATRCSSQRSPVNIVINERPGIPGVAPVSICGAGTVTITVMNGAPSGQAIALYNEPIGGTPIAIDNIPGPGGIFELATPPVSTSTTFFVESVNTSTQCGSERVPALVRVNSLPDGPISEHIARCGPGVATFTAVINGGSNRIRMYTLPIGGSPIFEDYGQSYNGHPFELQTPFIDTTHTYFFEAVNDMTGCSSQRIAYTVKINKYPLAPASQDLSACGSSAFTFTATLTDDVADGVMLYDSPSGGTPLSADNSAPYYLNAPQIGVTTTFWLASYSSATGCVSPSRVPVVGMIKTIPSVPGVNNAYRCGAGSVTFNAASSADLRLFNAPVGGNLLATGVNSVSTPILTTSGVYYISAFDPISGCESSRQAVRAIIETEPALPLVSNVARCGAGSVTLEVQMGNPQGNKIEVYADAGATTLVASANAAPYSINIPNLTQSTQLYVRALTTGGCQSGFAVLDVTIRPLPPTPLANAISRCGAGFGTFTASFAGASDNLSVILYEDAVNNTILASSANAPYLLPTPITESSRVYFIAAKDNILGCESPRVQVRFNIHPIPATPSATPIRLCGSQPAQISVMMGTPLGNEVRLYDAQVGGSVIASANQAPFTLFTPTVASSLTYYIASFDNATGCESPRSAVPINVMPLPSKPIAFDVNRCGAGSVIITAEMGPVPGTQIRLFTQLNGAAPLIVDATAPYHLATPELPATTTFYVESYANNTSCASQRAPVVVNVLPLPEKPLVADLSLCGSGTGTFTVNLNGGDVAELYATISGNSVISSDNSAPYALTTPVTGITTQYYIAALNSATGCRSERTMATLEIRPVPAAPQAVNASRCDIGVVTITATMSVPPGSEIRMYDAPSGNNLIAQATQSPYLLTTPILQTSATYYLESMNLSSGCRSERTPVVAVIQPTPDQPIISALSSCVGGDFTFTAQMGNITGTQVRLYNQPIGGSIVAEENTFPYTLKVGGVNASATYYATVLNAQTGCESDRKPVSITIHGLPGMPQAADVWRCGIGAVTITGLMGNPSGNEIALYNTSVGGVPVHVATNSPFILTAPSVSASTVFYLESRNTLTGCNSERKEVRVSIESQPGAPSVLSTSRCGGGTVTFEASLGSPSGNAIYLYDQAVGGALIASDNSAPFSLTVNNVSTTTVFYAVAVNSSTNCQGVRIPVTATIHELPGMPSALGISLCEPQAVIITALMGQPQGNTLRLYDSQLGGSPLATDSQAPYELLTPYITTTTVFYIESYLPGNGCSSARTPVTISRQLQPVAPIVENQQRCGRGAVTFGVISSGEGKVSVYRDFVGGEAIATASSAPWQLEIPDVLTTATYYLEQHNSNTGCVSIRTPFTVTILPVPQAPQVASVYRCGAGSGVFSAQVSDLNVAAVRMYSAPIGGTLLATDPSAPYTLQTPLTAAQTPFYFDVLSANGCASQRAEASLFIHPIPGPPSAEPKVLCGSGRTIINAQMGNPGAAMLRLFSSLTGGMPLATDATYPYELATPELNATTTFYVSSFEPGTGCESNRTPVVVSVNAIPPAPLVQDVIRCGAGTAVFSATIADVQVNEVRLYGDLSSSNMLATAMAPYHITTPFIEATTTFYVASVNATTRCESERVPVIATVKPAPGIPSALGVTRCGAGAVTITAQMGAPSGSQMRLYSQAHGVTPVASANTAPWILSPGSVNTSAVYYLESYNPLTGCASERVPVNVQVVEIPRTPTVASNGPICLNQELNLSASGSGEVAYLWRGPSGFAATGANPALTINDNSQAGLYSVVAINGSCSSETATTLVNLKPTPPRPIAGFYNETDLVKQICEGNELALEIKNYNVFPSGTRFTWVGPNTFLTTSHPFPSIPNIATINEGDYYILAFAEGCTSLASNSITVLVRSNPQPPIASNNGPICAGSGNIQLFASDVPGATAYIWSGPNGFVHNGQSASAPALLNNSGLYSVRAVVEGCTSAAATQMVEVIPMPNRPLASAPTSICAGQTLQLTAQGANPGAMYVWKGPNGFSAASFSGLAQVDNALPAASGVYTVTVVGAQCTSSAATVEVNVKEAPQEPTLTYSGPTCEGGSLKFTVSGIPGGVFMWHGPNGYVHTSDQLVLNRENVILSDGGVYSVSVIAQGCSSRPATVEAVINPSPVITNVQNNGPLCEGATLVLTATASQGATLHWSGPGGFIAHTASVTRNGVFVSQGGVYSAYATLGACTSAVINTQVTIERRPPTPSITNNGPVCAGGNVEFRVSGVEGATYYLYGPGGYQAAGVGGVYARPAVQSSHAGVYSVVAVLGNCTSSFSSTTLELKPEVSAPIAGNNSPLCPGQNLKLEAAGSPSGSYYWMGPDGFTQVTSASSISRPAITQQASGIYTVVAIANGCTSSSATTLVEIIPAPQLQTVGNNGPRCVGEELKLTAIGPVDAQYYWSGPANFSAIGANASRILSGVHEAGVYNVYAVVGGCTTGTLSTSVTVRPGISLGAISAPQSVCSGSTLVLSVPSVLGVTYQWSGPNNFSAVGSTVTRTNVSLFDSGNYTVTASNGVCSSISAATSVEVIATPSGLLAQSNGPVCVGQALQLNATALPDVTYEWSGPNGFSSSERNPVIANATIADAGYYSVIASNGACQSEPVQVEVSVVPQPRTPLASSNAPVCTGKTLTLNASNVTGATYQWSGPMGWNANEQNPSIPNVTTEMSGQYTVMAVIGNCYSAPASVSVQVRPTPATPVASAVTSSLCAGQSLQLQASTIAGATYTWSGPNNFSSASQNPVRSNVGVLDGGSYTVYVTQNGCRSEVASINVTVNPIPNAGVISHNGPVCAGSDLQLSAALQQGASYIWSGPAGFSASVINPVVPEVTTSNGGVYSLAVVQNGCTSRVVTATIQVNNCGSSCIAPSMVAAVAQGSDKALVSWQLPLSGTPLCYIVSYGIAGTDPASWTTSLVPHPNRTLVVENLQPNTVYSFRLRTNCTSCSPGSGVQSSWSAMVTATTGSAKVGSSAIISELKLYPNPNSGAFELVYQSPLSGEAQVVVYDITGKDVYRQAWNVAEGENTLALQLSLPSGIYIVELLQGEHKASLKMQVR